MTSRTAAIALVLAAALAACAPDDATPTPENGPAATEPAATGPAEPAADAPVSAALPEVRYYQISDG